MKAAVRPGEPTVVKLGVAEGVLRVPMPVEGAAVPQVLIPYVQGRFELLVRLSKRPQFHSVVAQTVEAEGSIVLGREEEGVAAGLPVEAE